MNHQPRKKSRSKSNPLTLKLLKDVGVAAVHTGNKDVEERKRFKKATQGVMTCLA